MGGVQKDVIEKNFPIFSFGFVFGCLFLLIAGLGFSAIQSFRLSSGSLTSAFLITLWPIVIDMMFLRPLFCFTLALVLAFKSKLYSREKVKMDLGMVNTKLIGTDFNTLISGFYHKYQFYKSASAPKHVLNVEPEFPKKREMSYKELRARSRIVQSGSNFHLCGLDKKRLRKNQLRGEQEFLSNGFVVIELGESLEEVDVSDFNDEDFSDVIR